MAFICERIRDLVWGPWLVSAILGMGLYLSVRTGFVQITCFPRALGLFFSSLRERGAGDFRALCTALAATVGTGNLVGVAGAIALGGPGTVFWMWMGGFWGMATKFAEATLAVRYRTVENGQVMGGPMYMIRGRLGQRWRFLACAYALFGVIAAFGVGNTVQINAVVCAIDSVAETNHILLGLVLAALVGAVVLGGINRIGEVAEVLVPFASVVYLLLAVTVLCLRFEAIPGAFRAIFEGAFHPRAAIGIGISRGVFTNEAGMGTASIAHAAARVEHPGEQGLMGVVEVFLDTIVICTMTALVILCSGVPIPWGEEAGGELTAEAFSVVCGPWVRIMLSVCICAFAFATVLGWGLYGARCARFLWGSRGEKWFAKFQTAAVFCGVVLDTAIVWPLSEAVNGLMAIPNLIILAALSEELSRLTIDYKISRGHRAAGGTYEHENFYQCQPLPAFSHEKVPSFRPGGQASGQEDLPSEHRSARPAHS